MTEQRELTGLERETIEELESCQTCYGRDYEMAHRAADEAIMDFLEVNGHREIVEAWRAVPRWYS